MDQHSHPTRINLIIVDDHPVIRAGPVTLLEGYADINVIGVAESTAAALHLLEQHDATVRVALIDVNLPDKSGVICTKMIGRRWPNCQVVLFTCYPQFAQIGLRAGARGFLLKDSPPEELVTAIRTVARGDVYLHKDIQRDLVNILQQVPRALPQLSEHEIRILVEMAQGAKNQEIGQILGFSEPTVKMQVSAIYQKLGVRNRAEAISVALRLGLLDAEHPNG